MVLTLTKAFLIFNERSILTGLAGILLIINYL